MSASLSRTIIGLMMIFFLHVHVLYPDKMWKVLPTSLNLSCLPQSLKVARSLHLEIIFFFKSAANYLIMVDSKMNKKYMSKKQKYLQFWMEHFNFKNIKKKLILYTWTNAPVEFELIVCGSQAWYLNHWAMAIYNQINWYRLTKYLNRHLVTMVTHFLKCKSRCCGVP